MCSTPADKKLIYWNAERTVVISTQKKEKLPKENVKYWCLNKIHIQFYLDFNESQKLYPVSLRMSLLHQISNHYRIEMSQ